MLFRPTATLALAALALVACGDDDPTGPVVPTLANVKVIHAVADAPPVDIRIDEAAPAVDVYVGGAGAALPTTPALTNVPFRGAAYLPAVPAGSYRVCVVLAGSGTAGGCAIDVTTGTIPAGVVATAVALDPAPGAQAPGALLTVDRQP